MATVIIWVVAYLATGFRWVWRDQRRRAADRKGYVGSRSARWTTRLLWLPLSVVLIFQYSRDGDPKHQDLRELLFEDVLGAYAIFLILGFLTMWLASR
jgi:hypothetical protein